MNRRPVLVVDDDENLRLVLGEALLRDGHFQPIEAADGAAALALAEAHPDALMLLDISLPDRSGLDVLRELRRSSQLPVILLTGRASEMDIVIGLELGADDYVVKPCFPREVVARVRTVLRRTAAPTAGATLRFGDLVISLGGRTVRCAEAPVELTAREFDLLAHLAANPGQTFSRHQLLLEVWGAREGWQSEATVTEHVYRLRAKLTGPSGHHRRLRTVRGVGYAFEA